MGRATALKKLPPQEIKPRNRLAAAAASNGKIAIVSWQGTLLVLWGDKLEHSTPWLTHPADRSRANAADFAPPTWAGTPMPGADFRDFHTWQTYADDCRRLNAAAFSPGGDLLAVASGFHQRGCEPLDALGRIYIWRLADWHTRELVTSDENRWFEAVAWSPDGGLIAGGTRNGMICLFDAQSGEFVSEFLAHGASITALGFMRNGSALVTAAEDGSIGVWRR